MSYVNLAGLWIFLGLTFHPLDSICLIKASRVHGIPCSLHFLKIVEQCNFVKCPNSMDPYERKWEN